MKNILKVLALMFAIGFSQIANAQLYNDEACFYICEGKTNPERVSVVRFNGDKIYYAIGRIESIRKILADDPSFFDNMDCQTHPNGFDFPGHEVSEYGLDNSIESSKIIYSKLSNNGGGDFYAFSDDMSFFVIIYRANAKCKFERRNKNKFVRVSKDYFSPQGVNDDVLRLLEEE